VARDSAQRRAARIDVEIKAGRPRKAICSRVAVASVAAEAAGSTRLSNIDRGDLRDGVLLLRPRFQRSLLNFKERDAPNNKIRFFQVRPAKYDFPHSGRDFPKKAFARPRRPKISPGSNILPQDAIAQRK